MLFLHLLNILMMESNVHDFLWLSQTELDFSKIIIIDSFCCLGSIIILILQNAQILSRTCLDNWTRSLFLEHKFKFFILVLQLLGGIACVFYFIFIAFVMVFLYHTSHSRSLLVGMLGTFIVGRVQARNVDFLFGEIYPAVRCLLHLFHIQSWLIFFKLVVSQLVQVLSLRSIIFWLGPLLGRNLQMGKMDISSAVFWSNELFLIKWLLLTVAKAEISTRANWLTHINIIIVWKIY
jgi:hypothetical protein